MRKILFKLFLPHNPIAKTPIQLLTVNHEIGQNIPIRFPQKPFLAFTVIILIGQSPVKVVGVHRHNQAYPKIVVDGLVCGVNVSEEVSPMGDVWLLRFVPVAAKMFIASLASVTS